MERRAHSPDARAVRARLLLSLALVAAVSAAAAPAARATVVGIGDQDPAAFADARLRALHLGGLVTLRNASGIATLPADETRAATAIARAFAIARTRPRVTVMYVYHWRAGATDRFDAGLVRPDGTARPGLATLSAALRAAAPPVRWSARWSSRGRLVVRATCRAASGRCRGRAAVTLRLRATGAWAARRLASRSYATTPARRTATITLRVPAAVRRHARAAARRRVALAVRPPVRAGAASTVTLGLTRPR
jgi:hypothetical protein